MKSGDQVGAYVLKLPLGKGAGGSAWTATRAPLPVGSRPDDEVVIKVLDIGEAEDWSFVDLIKREAAALRALSHPGIPKLLDDFEDSSGGKVRLVLVMERVPGTDLESALEGGRRFSDAEVERVLADLASILAY
ncbi:MAG: hypothetical protein Q8M76_05680, partial [Spirochaetaceae bacterium]|nr:hypothetical protein [Spirochaetaceae bacterium]